MRLCQYEKKNKILNELSLSIEPNNNILRCAIREEKKFITEHTTNKQIEIEVAGRSGTDKINIGSDRDNKQPDFIIESHDL